MRTLKYNHCFQYSTKSRKKWSVSRILTFTEKKDLIESKKMICLKEFLWFKEMNCLNEIKLFWFKQNIFEPNNFFLKQINFIQNKEINAFMYGQRYTLFDLRQKFIWFKQIFIWSKDILFESNKFCFIKTKHFFTSKKVFLTNYFFDSIKYFCWVLQDVRWEFAIFCLKMRCLMQCLIQNNNNNTITSQIGNFNHSILIKLMKFLVAFTKSNQMKRISHNKYVYFSQCIVLCPTGWCLQRKGKKNIKSKF